MDESNSASWAPVWAINYAADLGRWKRGRVREKITEIWQYSAACIYRIHLLKYARLYKTRTFPRHIYINTYIILQDYPWGGLECHVAHLLLQCKCWLNLIKKVQDWGSKNDRSLPCCWEKHSMKFGKSKVLLLQWGPNKLQSHVKERSMETPC